MASIFESLETDLALRCQRCCGLMRQYVDTLATHNSELAAQLHRESFDFVETLIVAGLYEDDSDDYSALQRFSGIDMALAIECVKFGNACEPDDRLYDIALQAREQAPTPTLIVEG
jgi:hypothetical protein